MRTTLAALTTALGLAALLPPAVQAESFTLEPSAVTDWKAVYARIEARDRIPARARLGGTLVELNVTEGDLVEAGQPLARIVDEKLEFQMNALDAQLQALESQLANAKSELSRGEELLERGVTTAQRLDGLRTQVEVFTNQIEATKAERRVIEQQVAEGTVLAPLSGRALDVPVAAGSVVAPGEAIAVIGGGGFFLRLAVPERHAGTFQEGDTIQIETSGSAEGRLARVYPQIENGRVIADVEVEGLDDAFVDARVLVRLPIGERSALLVPHEAVETVSGIDFVTVEHGGEPVRRAVVLGGHHVIDGEDMVEVVTGLEAGEKVVTDHE
ncbi:efflux RND transporter periplasmic adaptor subunit [Oricola thermophila]|uniref:Efflux RND transporter periplasmic adaptor subunit n=1 Tax=Oricola thermophila TaxID=2742145 RepID=A0A6N1VCJ6_9HYPH|nr:efflux RND transporter periplasmic adaptor subunit [Oricola thermophila]QKV18594.1 efflux RND transporter periplasmic adaptor subunit [Oricola thermophila]